MIEQIYVLPMEGRMVQPINCCSSRAKMYAVVFSWVSGVMARSKGNITIGCAVMRSGMVGSRQVSVTEGATGLVVGCHSRDCEG